MLSLFPRRIGGKKGFTLVEIMIVVAVIGILAAVLIPGALSMKNDAKSAGVDTNIRGAMAAAQAIISNYSGDNSPYKFASALATKIGTGIKNPVTDLAKVTVVADLAAAVLVADSSVIIVSKDKVATVSQAPLATDEAHASTGSTYLMIDPTNGAYKSAVPANKGCVIGIVTGTVDNILGITFYAVDASGTVTTTGSKPATFTVLK